jgi:hypothetical protein
VSTTLVHAQQQLLGLLDECWKGILPGADFGYFGDEESGLEQSLAGMTAEQASRIIGKTSIAGQVKHTAICAAVNAASLRGEETDTDWDASFITGELDDAAWSRLREELWAALTELRREIEARALASDKQLQLAHGAVAHVVYHLGGIRAKLTVL